MEDWPEPATAGIRIDTLGSDDPFYNPSLPPASSVAPPPNDGDVIYSP
jgi:hypothetical protein